MDNIIEILKKRFLENKHRHENIDWSLIDLKLKENPDKIIVLQQMEITGGEPDVVGFDFEKNKVIFYDCSKETPIGRRSLCYDDKALKSRKKFPPKDSCLNMVSNIGSELLNEEDYFYLQDLEKVDEKTSSWLLTPEQIRDKGGAIFGDYKFGRTFIYHNGADSYYESRGFRTKLIF